MKLELEPAAGLGGQNVQKGEAFWNFLMHESHAVGRS
jgi:hypothetical protein